MAAKWGPVSYAILSLARVHRARIAGLLHDLDLHPGQELLLMHLLERDGQTQSELVETVGLDHSTVSRSLRRLQEAGLVTREPAEHDRRVLHVRLTEPGRSLRLPLEDFWWELERICELTLTQAECRQFIQLASTLEHAIIEASA